MMRVSNAAQILLISLVGLVVTIEAQIASGEEYGAAVPVRTSVDRACAEGPECSGSKGCRIVFPCPNCSPLAKCINPQHILRGVDDTCKAQGLREAILFYKTPVLLFPLKCRGIYKAVDQCPEGSRCVDDGQSGGICCFGDNRCGVCPEGQGCYDRPPSSCIPGQPCIAAFVPTCVPHQCASCTTNEECIRRTVDGYPCWDPTRECRYTYECKEKGLCGHRPCPAGQWCTYTTTICTHPSRDADPSKINWDNYGCFEQYQCQGVDLCGGCQNGYECVDTGIRCLTEPCPSYQCRKIDNCYGQCRFNQECKGFYPECPSFDPRCNPTFECVDLPGYGSCKMVKIDTGC